MATSALGRAAMPSTATAQAPRRAVVARAPRVVVAQVRETE